MALPSSGPLALTDIQTEFGGANPIGMNEYYAGGGLVPAGTTGTYGAVPSSGALSVQNFYGTSNFVPVYVEDVFSAYLYTGNNAGYPGQTITNGINLASNGGMVWVKSRTSTSSHELYSSAQGLPLYLRSDSSGQGYNGGLNTFTTTGFQVDNNSNINSGSQNYDSWTFRKQPKFFDAITFTTASNGSATFTHSLGVVPSCAMLKRTDGSDNWYVRHTGLTSTSYCLVLNYDSVEINLGAEWLTLTSTGGSIPPGFFYGNSTYVLYLYASNNGGFGLTGSDNVITCGSFTGAATVNLGYEPQWVLLKATTTTQDWFIIDNMMGWTADGTYSFLNPNNAYPQAGGTNGPRPTSTGFYWPYGGNTYIYIAIRRGPMKVPTLGSSVYNAVSIANDSVAVDFGFPVDAFWETNQSGSTYNTSTATRLTGNASMLRTSSDVLQNGFFSSLFSNTKQNYYNGGLYGGGTVVTEYGFRRAPKFMDICAFTSGSGSTNHNLTVVPELVIYKSRTSNVDWYVCIVINGLGILNSSSAWIATGSGSGLGPSWADATSTTISKGAWGYGNGVSMVAYLFATCPGVSKVGIYTGTAALQTIDCGFTTGARFILIRRIDTSGDWYLYDSARGISSGADPYNLLNSTAADVGGTNYVDTVSNGFKVTAAAPAGLNADGGSYLFLAIA